MSKSKDSGYFEVSSLAGAKLFSRNLMGEIVMLNMLRFREVANYSASPALAPERPIAGEEAYRRYSIHTLLASSRWGIRRLFRNRWRFPHWSSR